MRFLLLLVTLFSVAIGANAQMVCTQQCAMVTCPGFTEQVEVCAHIPHPDTGLCYRPCPTPPPAPTCNIFRNIECPDDTWECKTNPCPTGRVCIPERDGTCVKKPAPTCNIFRGIECPDDTWECKTNPCTSDVCIPERPGTCVKKPAPVCNIFRNIECPDESYECVTSPCPDGMMCIPERPGTCQKKKCWNRGCMTVRCGQIDGVQTTCVEDPDTCAAQCKKPDECVDCKVTLCAGQCITTNGCGKCVAPPTPVCERVCPSNCGFNPDFQCVTDPITKCGKCVNTKATPPPKVCTERCTAKCSEWQDCVLDEKCTPTCKAKSCSVLFNQPCPESANCVDSCPPGMMCIPGRSGTCQPKPAEVFCTSNEGNQVAVGDKFYVKCNSCTCAATGEAGICTKIGCSSTACYNDAGKVVACPPPKPCECTGVHPMNVEQCADGTFANWKCVADADNKCSWKAPQCPTPVQCLIDPCDTPQATSTCIPNSCVANYATGCNFDCKKCTAAARSTTFTITYGNSRTTAKQVSAKMSQVAKDADFTNKVYKSMYIATPLASYIKRVRGNTWTVTVNFKQASCTVQESNMNAFIKQLQKDVPTSASISSIGEEEVLVDDNSYTTLPASDEAMAAKQACADGSEIDTAATCPALELAAPASSSSSSTPIAVIVAPIVGGVVLLAIIMTAVVIIRRRQAAQVKTMTTVQQDTQMAQRV